MPAEPVSFKRDSLFNGWEASNKDGDLPQLVVPLFKLAFPPSRAV